MINYFQLNYSLILIMMILGQPRFLFSQDWDNMNDSTYYHIVENRFNKGNFVLGTGGTIKTGYEDFSYVGVGIRPKVGYFIDDNWLLSVDFDYYYAWVRETEGNGKGNFYRYLVGLNARHYFKPKHRTVFLEFGPVLGNETNLTDEIDKIDSYNHFVYGGKFGIGVSVFIRQFELELIAGIKMYGYEYNQDFVQKNMYQLLQINVSYILSKQKNNAKP